MSRVFTRFARLAATVTVKPVTFLTAVTIIVVWAYDGKELGAIRQKYLDLAEHAREHAKKKKNKNDEDHSSN